MLELVHMITYNYGTHSVEDEKFYVNNTECTMYQFYNILYKHNNLVYHSRMNRTLNSMTYAELYRSNERYD